MQTRKEGRMAREVLKTEERIWLRGTALRIALFGPVGFVVGLLLAKMTC